MAVPSSVFDLSTTAASNSPAGSESIGTSLDDYLRAIQAIIKHGVSKGSDITAAATITPVATSSYFVVTGNTGITAIGETYSWVGRVVVLKFSGTPLLTHAAGLILPGAVNITAAAGDVAAFVNESAGVWRCIYGFGLSKAGGNLTGVLGLTAGTALLPALIPSGDPNTGVWFPAADTVAVSTGGVERMRIDSSGNVGIGVTPASTLRLHVKGSDTTASNYAAAFQDSSGNNIAVFRNDKQTTFYGDTVVIQPAGLGYGTGAGGTVTQATSKSTAVTLNKPTGQITTNNSLLAGGITNGFQLNNSLISSADNVIVTIQDGNGYKYNVWAYAIQNGNCQIALQNITGGNLSEALPINFAIIKGATS